MARLFVQRTDGDGTRIGTEIEIGNVIYGTEIAIKDYSRKERDPFGDGSINLIKRGYTDVISYKLEVPTENLGSVKNTLALLRAEQAAYVTKDEADEEIPELTVTGYLNSFSLPFEAFTVSTISLEVESQPKDVPVTTKTVTFDLAGGTRTGGGELTQTFTEPPYTATAPTLTPPSGKTHTGWDKALTGITASTTITATYSTP